MMNIEINHVLIRTTHIEAMIRFFEQTLNLKNGYRPSFPFRGAWLWADDRPLIHLSEVDPEDKGQLDYLDQQNAVSKTGTGIIDHIAFSGSDYPDLIERLKRYRLDYFERTVPTSDEHQVFVQGPEGLRVEIQFAEKQSDLSRREK
jgi:lactoylglutathione lyase